MTRMDLERLLAATKSLLRNHEIHENQTTEYTEYTEKPRRLF